MLEFRPALESLLERTEGAGLPVLDAILVDTLDPPPEEKEAYFKGLFASLQPGVTHFLIHPARPSDELSSITEDAPQRARDYELFRDGSMRSYLEGMGVHLIGYREIREAYRDGALKI